MNEIIISLCDLTGNIVEPWARAGYECYCIDLQHEGHTVSNNVHKIKTDVHSCISSWLPIGRKVAFACAFPSCTHTSVSGAKYFVSKGPKAAAEAFTLISCCFDLLKWFGAPYFLEQPVSTSSTYCGQPDHWFHPCDYAGYLDDPTPDSFTKKTCLWTGHGFKMPQTKPVEPVKVCAQGSWLQKLGGPSLRTKNLRSATPKGFAEAVYVANRQ